MTERPKFSAIIATCNRRDYVLQAVESITRQTYSAHEIIVVVDGVTDDTPAALRQCYPNVVVLEQPNLGRAAARNFGLARATGNWVCFLDDDDLWHAEKLAAAAAHIEAHSECIALNNPIWFFTTDEDGPAGGFGFARDFVARDLDECQQAVAQGDPSVNDTSYLDICGDSFARLLERNLGVMSASVVQREIALRAGGFPPMETCGEDWTFFVNVARFGEWHTLPRRLGFTRLHNTQSSGNFTDGLHTLIGIAHAWYAGRPLPERTRGLDFVPKMTRYGATYRQAIQGYFWSAVFARQWKLARLIRAVGRTLLPNASDWIYVNLPPQLTWRWERWVLGMHRKQGEKSL